jgi:hypothetical protein
MAEVVGFDRECLPLHIGDLVRYVLYKECPPGTVREGSKGNIIRVVFDDGRGDTWQDGYDFRKMNLLQEIAEAAKDDDD